MRTFWTFAPNPHHSGRAAHVTRPEPNAMTTVPKTRIDLTDYRIYIDVLLERLNQDSVYKMSMEDMYKIFTEQAMAKYCPDIVICPNRRRFETWKF
jgi:hypothetical protein